MDNQNQTDRVKTLIDKLKTYSNQNTPYCQAKTQLIKEGYNEEDFVAISYDYHNNSGDM